MAIGDYIQEQLRNALQLLELADLEAIRAKQQLGRIIGEDFQVGSEIRLVPSVFWVEGVPYRAMVTDDQHKAIQAAAGGQTQDVTSVVADMLNNELYSAAYQALVILVSALTNQPLPKFAGPETGQSGAQTPNVHVNPIGACQFSSGKCYDPYGATLCESQGGTIVPDCTHAGPDHRPVRVEPAAADAEDRPGHGGG
jgi:hypothetical protein